MNIVIAGMDEMGIFLARQLDREPHNITVIDSNQERLRRVAGSPRIRTVLGEIGSSETLRAADAHFADLVAAISLNQNDNLKAAMESKQMGARRTIARLTDLYHSPTQSNRYRGIDYIFHPDHLVAMEITKQMERTAADDLQEFEKGQLLLVGLRPTPDSPIMHRKMVDLKKEDGFPHDLFRVIVIQRGLKTIIPEGGETILPGDQVFLMTTPSGLPRMHHICGIQRMAPRKVMILGEGRLAGTLAELLAVRMHVKLLDPAGHRHSGSTIEPDTTFCVNEEGKTMDLLIREGLMDMDAFISVTEDAETNLFASLFAKHLRIPKVVSMIQKAEYTPLASTVGIDLLVNRDLIAAQHISRFLSRVDRLFLNHLYGTDVTVREFIIPHNASYLRRSIQEISFPHGAIVAGYIRNNRGHIATGNSVLESGDRVIILSRFNALESVESFFRTEIHEPTTTRQSKTAVTQHR